MDQLTKNIQAQQLSIEHQMERINESRITIHEYKQKLLKLNQKLNVRVHMIIRMKFIYVHDTYSVH